MPILAIWGSDCNAVRVIVASPVQAGGRLRGKRGYDEAVGLWSYASVSVRGERDLGLLTAAGGVGEDGRGVEFVFATLFEEVVGERVVRVVSDVFF